MYFLREGFIYFALSMKGRGECRALTAPAASRASWKKHTSIVTTGSAGITRHSPRNGFNRYGVLSLVRRAFWPPSPALSSRRLDTSVGVPGPHVFAVRIRCSRQKHRPRPPHPAPRFLTLRNAPLRDGTAKQIPVFRGSSQALFLYFGNTLSATNWRDGQSRSLGPRHCRARPKRWRRRYRRRGGCVRGGRAACRGLTSPECVL